MSTTRYRCTACGNLTRFDVTSTRTTRQFQHFTVGGDLVVDVPEVSQVHRQVVRKRAETHPIAARAPRERRAAASVA